MNRPTSASPTVGTARAGSLLPPAWLAQRDKLMARWSAMGRRDRRIVLVAAALVGVFLLWSVAIQPAWQTVRDAPSRIDQLGAQLQTMQSLAAEVAELRDVAPVSASQAAAALQGATDRLGDRATMVQQGDRATVNLNGMSGDDLRSWLAEVRSAARARVAEVQLSRDASGYTGTIVLTLGGGR